MFYKYNLKKLMLTRDAIFYYYGRNTFPNVITNCFSFSPPGSWWRHLRIFFLRLLLPQRHTPLAITNNGIHTLFVLSWTITTTAVVAIRWYFTNVRLVVLSESASSLLCCCCILHTWYVVLVHTNYIGLFFLYTVPGILSYASSSFEERSLFYEVSLSKISKQQQAAFRGKYVLSHFLS